MITHVTRKLDPLPKWIELNVRLPAGIFAVLRPIKLYPYQRGIAAPIGDPKVERVTILKWARVGYTAAMTAAIEHCVVCDPSPPDPSTGENCSADRHRVLLPGCPLGEVPSASIRTGIGLWAPSGIDRDD